MTGPAAVAVSGHMVDAPGRPVPRFPPEQEPRVAHEVREALRSWGVGAGTTIVCGGARGADIIAAEEGLALGARVKLCLALPPDEFEPRSVALPGTDWSARFRALLRQADVQTMDEVAGPPPPNDGIFARANQWIVEEARALANGRPHGLVVWDGHEGDGPGGTIDFVHRLGYDGPDHSVAVIDPTPRRYEARQGGGGPKRILALDGGGIRGMLSLEILAAIERGLRRHHGPDLVLADWFDYIGGTSTGAILATGLALGMSVGRLIDAYQRLGTKIFIRNRLPHHALYPERPLREQLENVFGRDRVLGDRDLRTLLLVVLHNTETDSAWPLSNCTRAKYNRAERCLLPEPDRNLDLSLVELLRGSTAAPVYFPAQRIKVGRREFVFQDGGITPFNNPALLLLLMATLPEYGLRWPVGEDKLLIVSVGTGATPAVHDQLLPGQAGFLFNAKNLPSVFMNGGSVGQDLLCRALGRCRYGEPLDREVGDRLNVTGIAGTNLFSYVRYNAILGDRELIAAGFTDKRERRRIRKLDGVKATGPLRAIGRSVGEHVDVARHFEGFLHVRLSVPPSS